MWNISSVLTENYKSDIVSIVRFIPYLKIQKLNCISPFHPTDYKCQLLSGINRSHRGYGSKIRKWPCLLGLLAWLLSTAASWRHGMGRHLYYWPLVMVMPWRLCDVTVMFWDSIHEAMLMVIALSVAILFYCRTDGTKFHPGNWLIWQHNFSQFSVLQWSMLIHYRRYHFSQCLLTNEVDKTLYYSMTLSYILI